MIKKVLLLLFLSVSTSVFSQNYSSVTGKIFDVSNKQPIEGAVIEISELKIKAGSDASGSFRFDSVPVGRYTVKASALGYMARLTDNVIVNSGSFTDLVFELESVSTEEILVEDERFAKPNDISTSIKNLQYEEIRRTPGGFEDIGRVIQSLPGV